MQFTHVIKAIYMAEGGHMIKQKIKQLTVAIPAYNAEAYLEQCLDSLVGNDTRLEIIE